jgi:DNA-binding transcriptional MerR regulator
VKEFLSVNEFSKLSGIERTTLRYWDEIGLFSPARRDPENNYRYYSPEQIIGVNFISVLSELNIPLKTIGAAEKGRTPESIVLLIEQQEKRLDMELKRLHDRQAVMHERLDLIRDGIRMLKETASGGEGQLPPFSVRHRPEKVYLMGPKNYFEEGESFYGAFMRFCARSRELRINLNFPIGAFHTDMGKFVENPGRPDRFISVDPTGNYTQPAGEYLVGYVRGYYGDFGDLAERMRDYAEEHGLTCSGPVFTIYIHDEICMKDPSQYLVQASVAVSRK